MYFDSEYFKSEFIMKPEVFFWGLMDKQIERAHGALSLYMIIVERLLCVQNWKDVQIPTVHWKNGSLN